MIHHAGCVARLGSGGWSGVVLVGSSGVGKTDLMLRLIERDWLLVGDDRLHLWSSGGRLYARAPTPLSGLIEARGLDVLAVPRREVAAVALIVDCLDAGAEVERIARFEQRRLAGVSIPALRLHPLQASAAIKVELASAQATRSRRLEAAFLTLATTGV